MEILAILFSPIIAVLISLKISSNMQKRRDKLDIFKILMTTRESWSTMDFVKSVNAIDVIFHDGKEVRQAWRELYDSFSATSPDTAKIAKNHTKLLEKMAVNLGYKDQITWEDITSSYTPHWLTSERQNETEYKNLQMELMRNTLKKIESEPGPKETTNSLNLKN